MGTNEDYYIPATKMLPGCIYKLALNGCSPLKYLGLDGENCKFEQSGLIRYLSLKDITKRMDEGKIWVKASHAYTIDANRRQQIAAQLLAALLSNPEYLSEALPNLVLDAVNATDLLLQELNKGEN